VSDLPLLLAAASQHPDPELRSRVRQGIDELVEGANPTYSVAEVSAALATVRGTPLEPFELSEGDLDVVIPLVRFAFSARQRRTRFRVVSRETLGTEGGAVLTNNLRHFYIERFVGGNLTRTPAHYWFVAPAELPVLQGTRTAREARHRALCSVTDHGITITIDAGWLPHGITAREAAEAFGSNGYIGPKRTRLKAVGIRVDARGGRLELRTGSPEAIVKLSAFMDQRATLVLYGGSERDGLGRVFIPLSPLVEEESELNALVTFAQWPGHSWVGLDAMDCVPLGVVDRLSIARWYRPHDDWIDDKFLTAMLS
jgi:hypothetical protein